MRLLKINLLLIIVIFCFSCKTENIVNQAEIKAIVPTAAYAGDTIVIQGSNLSDKISVKFGDKIAAVLKQSVNSLDVRVPPGDGIVLVKVLADGGASNDKEFTYLLHKQPRILSIEPSKAFWGDTVMIKGTGFDKGTVVRFGGINATVLEQNGSSLRVIVPAGKGNTPVVADCEGRISNQSSFLYLGSDRPYDFDLQGTNYRIDTLAYYKAGPGVTYLALNFTEQSNTLPIKVFLSIVDVTNPHIDIKQVLANDKIGSVEDVVSMGNRKNSEGGNSYITGINGGYFDANSIKTSAVVDKSAVYFVPASNDPEFNFPYSPVFIRDKKLSVDRMYYRRSVILSDGSAYNISNINGKRLADYLTLYNKYKGANTETNPYGTEIIVVPVSGDWGHGESVRMKVTQINKNSGSTPLPENGIVLSGHGQAQAFLDKLNVNDIITVNSYMESSGGIIPDQMLAGPNILIWKGAMDASYTDAKTNNDPRTAVGTNKARSKIYFCVVDGRQEGVSVGVSTRKLAIILNYYGANEDAVNLDGGGSSTMYLKNAGVDGLVNKPSYVIPRKVGNALFAVSSAPKDNNITEITCLNYELNLAPNATVTPEFYGINKYGEITGKVSGVILTSPSTVLGTVTGGNTFKAGAKSRYGYITAKYNNIETKVRVVIQ